MGNEASSAGTLARGNLTYLPVVPGRIEFALRVRRYLVEHRPRVVAVELPSSLEREYTKALDRMPQMSVIVIPDNDGDEERATYIPVEPADPFVEALRTAREISAQTIFLEPATHERPHVSDDYPEPYSIEVIGFERYVETYRIHPQERTPEIEAHASAMAWKLQGADPLASSCVVLSLNMLDAVLDAMEMPQEEPPLPRARLFHTAELFNLHPDCLAEVTSEPPYYQEIYETIRRQESEPVAVDRTRWQLALLREAEKEYAINTGEKIQSWQRLALAKFTRNLAVLDARLIAGAYDLALGARSIVDDNYAYEVWQMANRYSVQQTEDPSLETLNISGEEVWVRTRKLRLRRRLPRMKQMLRPASLKPRKREKFKGEWASQTNGTSICSYPPEDLVIENYGRFLKRYAKTMLSEERSRVEPFTTSTLDGIDLRETLRNWHEKKLYVREMGKFSGETGALIIIFDEDRNDRYGYLTTWLGEHQNESDMAFYSTQPFEHIVGPGIGRAEYGGLLMTLPPRRLYDVWSDTDYDSAETKAEKLLLAGLDYSVERYVIYIAAKPPRSIFRQIAARVNRKIVYIPLGQLSPARVKKIRVVHVLDGYQRREEAKQYIW
ncbi:MAG: hypothetical protein JO097_14340 [Acidobacteriaceae bacterium]|nr:hypothetical protein [Acidobacteriaceae bacterium]MBV9764916.1 hypothetical protein [Acidobacteriaceae bacterium]